MFSDLLIRLRSVFRRDEVESELDEELRFHFEKQVDKYVASGVERPEALRRARLELGGHEQLKEECRDARGTGFVETLLQDMRYGIRVLGRTPVVTGVAILSLALGIGANTAIFSMINSVMLRSLPVQKPEELVQVARRSLRSTEQNETIFTNPIWEAVRDHQDVFSNMFAWSMGMRPNLAQGGEVQPAEGMFVSGRYFETLGVRPATGRLIQDADDHRGCPAIAVMSYGFWTEHYGASQKVIGSSVLFDGHPFQIVGVTAPGFYGVEVGKYFDVAAPICTAALYDEHGSRLDRRSFWWLEVMGRVKPGVTLQTANARLAVVAPRVFQESLPTNWKKDMQDGFLKNTLLATPAATGISGFRREFERPLTILMVVVVLVLLIACANIASLMLARATVRRKEIAVRKALGASRGRLIRQLLTECVLLSSTGAVLGILFAKWGNALLVKFMSTSRTQLFLEFPLDYRVLGFTVGVAVLTGILFGLFPALRSTRVSLLAAMKGSAGADTTERQLKFRAGKWIVAVQVALSLVLLVTAGLFLRSFSKLNRLDVGFDRNNVLIVNANMKNGKVPVENRVATTQQIEDRLRALPGVISVGASLLTPLSHFVWNENVIIDSPNAPKGDEALAYMNFVSPNYLPTMRIPVLSGRNFNGHDVKGAPLVAIVNETLARKFFPNENPIGKLFKLEGGPGEALSAYEIVGVMKDTKYETVQEVTLAQAIFPFTQVKDPEEEQNFEVRTAMRPSLLATAAEEAIGNVNKSLPLEFQTLARQMDESITRERLLATLSGFFGGLALLLAMIGLYGALSFLVTQRQTEFGIRMALGAAPNSILGLVMKDLMFVLGGGIFAGVAVSLATVGLLQKMLFGLAPRDTFTIVTAIGTLVLVAVIAGYFPARRAMRVDPMVALRYE